MPEPTVLDHVAVAVQRWADAFPRLRRDLGGEWVAGGGGGDFVACQLRFTGGMKVELLAPDTGDGFLRRFLARNGPGVHHLTFKVPDLPAAIAAAEAAGYPAVDVDLTDPDWKEAFLRPSLAHGIVVQMAQASGGWQAPPPADLPAPAVASPARLLRVGHAVGDLHGAALLFTSVLGGEEVDAGDGWIDLAWPGGGAVRLLAATGDLAAWVGERPGRAHHLAFAVADPSAVDGARPGDGAGDAWEVPAAPPLGVRLLLEPLSG